MSEKIADWTLHHVNTSYERTAEKSLKAVSNWKTDGDIDHYGAGFGTLIVAVSYTHLTLPTKA